MLKGKLEKGIQKSGTSSRIFAQKDVQFHANRIPKLQSLHTRTEVNQR